jgi:hypothetical protein
MAALAAQQAGTVGVPGPSEKPSSSGLEPPPARCPASARRLLRRDSGDAGGGSEDAGFDLAGSELSMTAGAVRWLDADAACGEGRRFAVSYCESTAAEEGGWASGRERAALKEEPSTGRKDGLSERRGGRALDCRHSDSDSVFDRPSREDAV